MRTTVLNPTLWLLAGILTAAAWSAFRGEPASAAVERFVRVATRRAVAAGLAVLALGAISSRVVLGYLAPGAYAEEVVLARTLLADRATDAVDARAELSAWLREEPAAAAPWLMPGLTACQAGAMRERARFFSGQAHSPALLLASVPVVRAAGGRGLFVWIVFLSLAALALAWRTLVAEAGWAWRSPSALLLAIAIAGWQPVLAGLRQGDAVLVAASLLVVAWSAARRERWALAGVLAGTAGAIALPALLVVPALVRRPRALLAALVAVATVAIAVSAVGGQVLLVDYARNVAFTTRSYAEMPVNYAVAGRLLALLPWPWLAAAGVVLVGATLARTRRVDVSLASLGPLAVMSSPLAWSQHLALVLVPAALLGRAAARSSAPALASWALGVGVLSLPDPAVTWLTDALWPGASRGWPIVSVVVGAAWAAALVAPDAEAPTAGPGVAQTAS